MSGSMIINLAALFSLVPASLLAFSQEKGRDGRFWATAILAAAGPVAWSAHMMSGAWPTELAGAVWVSIAATALLFLGLSILSQVAWRLAPLLMPYLAIMGALATLVGGRASPVQGNAPVVWLDLHILVSVLTYGMLTLAAVTSLAVFLQERALKRKRPSALTRRLPSVVEGEKLSGRLLLAGEIVLGLGVATGMATQYLEMQTLLKLDHKALLSLIAFGLIGALLLGHRVCGVRGRIAARVVLVAYLLVTLAYPGVKFVTQVLR
jgi:ABC-type uncharacterized transport system permease subunit